MMPEVEKVIKGLECCAGYGIEDTPGCEDCPYNDMGDTCERMRPLYEDALALLRAQEPVNPNVIMYGKMVIHYQCPACLVTIDPRDNFCRHCGRAVKWE